MILPFTHPTMDQLSELNAAAPEQKRADVAAHVRDCVRCQESLRFIRHVNDAGASVGAAPPTDLLARALAARWRGERSILPATPSAVVTSKRWAKAAAGAAAAVLLAAIMLSRGGDLVAEGADSSMRLTPGAPRAGARIEVAYRPSAGLFTGHDSLVLRARYRKPGDLSYSYGLPASQVFPATTLRRARNGEFRGAFTLPDGVVFGSFSVETHDASVVDANGTRLWEVMVHAPDGRPVFDALDQRAHDMMGRSWDEAYGSAKRATELYPDRIGGWSYREFFERAIYGEAAADSIAKQYAAKRDSLIAAARAGGPLSEDDMATVFYRVSSAGRRGTATPEQRAALAYWHERIVREYPRNGQVAQHVAFNFTPEQWKSEQRFILDSLERALPNLVPLRGPGMNLTNAAMQAANSVKDDAAYRRWYERSWAGASDSALYVALMLSARPAFRMEGMAKLREAAAAPAIQLVPRRSMFWNATEYERRVNDERRRALVALGRALIAEGQTRAGVDTLTLASRGVWNVDIFRSLLAGYVAAGDSVNADRIRVRLAVDPRTHVDTVARLEARGRARLGAGWDSEVTTARAEMHGMLRERSRLKTLRGVPTVHDASGRDVPLSQLTGGKAAVVIFWSRDCGWAVDALPQIVATANRLNAAGTPVILVNTTAYSKAVADYLAEQKWTLPVYYDARGRMAEAFNTFGVPTYYVLDGAGRIRFDAVEGVAELVAQVGAVK